MPQNILKINILASKVHSFNVLYAHQNSCHSKDPVISFPTDTQMNIRLPPHDAQ